jgi:hypothetical protein
MLGTGVLTVAADGKLSGYNKTTNALKNSSVIVNGTLRPGLLTLNSMFFDSKPVRVNETGVLEFNVSGCATATTNGGTSLEGISTLTVDGTIRIVPSATNTLKVGDSIRIFTAASFSGTPTFDMQGGIEWDTSRISEGLLFVKAIETGIGSMISDATPRNIYDVRGRLVRANATNTEGLPAGIYVCEGKKFVIK